MVGSEVEGDAVVEQRSLDADLERARHFLIILVGDQHRRSDEGVVRGDDRGRALVVKAAGFEADAPIGVDVGVLRRLPAELDLGLELAIGFCLRGKGTESLPGVYRPTGEGVDRGRHPAAAAAVLDVVAQRDADIEAVGDGIIERPEGGIDVGSEGIGEQQRCRVGTARCVIQITADALTEVSPEADAGVAVDVEIIDASLPLQRAVALRGQA